MYIFLYFIRSISYHSNKQGIIALSSTKIGYIAITEARNEALQIAQFLAF